MGFYGQVINYLTKAFSKVKVGNDFINANGYNDQLEVDSDSWIVLSPKIDDKKIIITHNTPQEDAEYCSLTIDNSDISTIDKENEPNGSKITIELPVFDEKGHCTKLEELQLDINIDDEIARTKQLRTDFNEEKERSSTEDLKLSEEIQAEINRAKEKEKDLEQRIGQPATQDTLASGVYAYVDETKAAILGKGISDTFDTLVEIQNWINGEGVNATELTTALEQESKKRAEEDKSLLEAIQDNTSSLQNKIDNNTERIDLLTNNADVKGSVAYAIAMEVDNRDKAIESAIDGLANIYETKSDAQSKLQESKDHTDTTIQNLKCDSQYSNEGFYVANISQENGVIKPVWQPVPFDTSAIKAVYTASTGNLVLPINLTIQ